jgi:hypothetical protein
MVDEIGGEGHDLGRTKGRRMRSIPDFRGGVLSLRMGRFSPRDRSGSLGMRAFAFSSGKVTLRMRSLGRCPRNHALRVSPLRSCGGGASFRMSPFAVGQYTPAGCEPRSRESLCVGAFTDCRDGFLAHASLKVKKSRGSADNHPGEGLVGGGEP